MSLLARCTGKHFLLLAGAERIVFEPQALEMYETLRRPACEGATT
jgi:FdhD protein